ncbi:MAG: beta-lactamase family protein [Treponema sp.]|jgi:CubicO group peptidase (beta-lactamase class C family)|nr:beta-lactamase family protein [Treponema sp.]
MLRKILTPLLIMLMTLTKIQTPAAAQTAAVMEAPDPAALRKFLDGFIREKMTEYHVPGAAIVVVKDGEVRYSKGYGYQDVEKKIPVDTEKTIFRVASVSKIFTIAGVLQLEEQGLLDLDRDVNEYLKNFQIGNDFDEPVRIRHLLTHTDGFETRDLGTFVLNPADLPRLEDLLKKDLKSPVQIPGSMITYGGYGAALAGCLISQAAEQPFEEYMDDNIFKPLDMRNSTFNQNLPRDLSEHAVVYHYEERGGGFVPSRFLYVSTAPTGALSATAEDMGKFIITLLNRGRLGGTRILRENTVEKMFLRQYSPHPSLPGVTYGFMESLYNGQMALIRDGSGVGIRSQIFLLPAERLGYFYVQNSRGDELADALKDAFLDEFYPSGGGNTEPLYASGDMKRYEGIYRPSQTARHTLVKVEALAIGDLKVSANGAGGLTVEVIGEEDIYGGFPKESNWVQAEPLFFREAGRERYMAFQENEEGEITGLVSAAGYHGSFVKIPWFESSRLLLYLLIFYTAVFFVIIAVNVVNVINRKRQLCRKNGVLTRFAGFVSLLYLAGISGALYTLFIKRIAGFPAFAFGVSLPAKVMLTLLMAAALLSAVYWLVLIINWISGRLKASGKATGLITAVVFLGTAGWLSYWNLLGYQF